MPLDPAQPVSELALEQPHVGEILARHGIDHLQSGQRTVREICALLEVSFEELSREIEGARPRDEAEWRRMPLAELVDHIEVRYHRRLEQTLPHLARLARKEARVAKGRDPAWYEALVELLDCFENEVVSHMYMEETLLFPHVRNPGHGDLDAVGDLLASEHAHLGSLLDRLKTLAGDEPRPGGESRSLDLLQGLRDLAAEMDEHVRLENDVLMKRLAD